MCDPVSMFAVGAAISGVSAIQSSQAASAQAQANANIAEYNAKVADNNVILANRAGTDAIQRGANDAAVIQDNIRRVNATARALQGSSGLLVDSGSNRDILDNNVVNGTADALTVLNNAQREAYGYKVQALNASSEAVGQRYQAQNDLILGKYASSNALLKGGGEILSGFGNASAAAAKSGSWWKF